MKVFRIPKDATYKEIKEMIRGGSKFDKILDIIECEGGNVVVIEEQFYDKEYYDEYINFYSSLFRGYPPHTTRIHFFREEKDDETGNEQEFYLGNCVLRPTEALRICEALIFPPEDLDELPKNFILCATEYDVEFKGYALNIRASPFIEAEGNVGACAQAAIWMVSKYMSRRYGDRHYTLHEITERATKNYTQGRPIPSHGLGIDQILLAMGLMGYNPLVYFCEKDKPSVFDVPDVVYKYVESEIPVLCASEKHMLTIIGHTFNPESKIETPKPEFNAHHSVEWVDSFICNDINESPYFKKSKEELKKEVRALFIPLPPNVNLKGEDVEVSAYSLLNSPTLRNLLIKAAGESTDTREPEQIVSKAYSDIGIGNGKCVVRTYLIESQRYKTLAGESKLADIVKEKYSKLSMPKFIWIVEVSNVDIFSNKRRMLGEIIYDATTPSLLQDLAYIAIHIPNMLIINAPHMGKFDFTVFSNDNDYEHFIRRVHPPKHQHRYYSPDILK